MGTPKKAVAAKKVTATATAAPAAAAKQKVAIAVNKAVRVSGEEFAGLVGSVEGISEDGFDALVHIAGVKDNQPFEVRDWFPAARLQEV